MRLSALMDPDNNKQIASNIGREEREEELQRYSLFPLYPTGVFHSSYSPPKRTNVTLFYNSVPAGL